MFNLRWLGQGGFLITLGDKVLCIDPYLSNSVLKLDGFERLLPLPIEPSELNADMIITTHDHMDHLDEETLNFTDYEKTLYAGPESCIKHFKEMGIEEKNLVGFNLGNSVKLGEAVIEAVFADHTSVDSIGVVLKYKGVTIYFVGDSLYNESLLKVKKYNPDILITCINGKLGNMNYLEAAKLAKELEVKVAIPCHYGMFAENTEDPKNFKDALNCSTVRYFEMEFNKEYGILDILNLGQ